MCVSKWLQNYAKEEQSFSKKSIVVYLRTIIKAVLFIFFQKISTTIMISSLYKLRPLYIGFALSLSTLSYAKVNVDSLLPILPEGTSIGFIAKNIDTQQIVAEYQSQTFMLPASTQKIFTALASRLTLPDSFRFETALLSRGTVKNGVLNGDLIARFTGDPTLKSQQLNQLVTQLKQQGINKIQGNLILDTSVFASHDKAPGWVWNDLSICFSAPAAAVNIDNNCFYANLDANQSVGKPIKVSVPNSLPVQVISYAYVADKNDASYCQLDAEMGENNRYYVKGCLARQSKPFSLHFAIQDPTGYGVNMLRADLAKAGIQFSGQAQVANRPQQGKQLAVHYSAPLSELLKTMMKTSDNQIADTLFRTIANQQSHRPASFPLASQEVHNVLTNQAKVALKNSTLADGSGLSRHNQISAESLLSALEYIAKNDQKLHLLDTLPIAGVDGTMSNRESVAKSPLDKNMIAKTGSLKGVYNLAGVMKNKRGERIVFAQLVNGYVTSPDPEKSANRNPLTQFENKLYMALYND
ncbi:D-alanyl-D-alanine carboxypeptidase/D-alanyl-D-alanine-endopeptidase (penicillin-binding protein 4) [Otariodibacter oris]|uniref:D-alanyl-D-alanine carboxypeptidase/D-alanyl-D-alanine-endopeptidase (Penicillin-binding protein 4) n=2 Tax=Otariodibacter oris TaxID=1032623 RepID=A0A420XJ43_9PAST|nr:D-alanyl-D-alanine carboxypeptidase/D-alanyl-D-alanine-endopeptidase (penicillin-binding protein 4) [Otariodibacter oris]